MVHYTKPDFTSWGYYFTHVATLLRTILQHFSTCIEQKKCQKFLKIFLFIIGTLYVQKVKVTKEFAISHTDLLDRLAISVLKLSKDRIQWSLFYDIFRPLKYHMVSYCPSPHFANFGIYFRTRKHAKINLFRRIMVQVIEKPL